MQRWTLAALTECQEVCTRIAIELMRRFSWKDSIGYTPTSVAEWSNIAPCCRSAYVDEVLLNVSNAVYVESEVGTDIVIE